MVCRNCSTNCPPQTPPTAPSIGSAGCSGNPASPTAPSNVTGYCCCPGNAHPPITTGFRSCCCSGGGSKAAVPSVEKFEKLKNYFRGKVPWILLFSAHTAAARRKWWTGLRFTCLRTNVQSLQTLLEDILVDSGFCRQILISSDSTFLTIKLRIWSIPPLR